MRRNKSLPPEQMEKLPEPATPAKKESLTKLPREAKKNSENNNGGEVGGY
jgi:hypothetical protein